MSDYTPAQLAKLIMLPWASHITTPDALEQITKAIEIAIGEEREACAKIATTCMGDFERDTPGRTESATRIGIAAAIRERGKT